MAGVAPGKHRSVEAQPEPSPAGHPLPWHGMPSDAGGVPWPQWDGPPPVLHPDHPSAPVPRVRVPPAQEWQRPGGQAPGRGPADNPAGPGGRPSRLQQQAATWPSPGSPPGPPARARPPAQSHDRGQALPSQYPLARGNPAARTRPAGPGYETPRGYQPDPRHGPGPGYGHGRQPGPGYESGWDYSVDGYSGPGTGRSPAHRAAGSAGMASPQEAFPDGEAWPARHREAGQAVTVAEDRAAMITREAWDQAAAIRRAAEQEAAAIQRHAADQAGAIRRTAEHEAAQLRSVLMTMSADLGQMAAYVTEYLGKHAAMPDDGPQGRLTAIGETEPGLRPAVTGPARVTTPPAISASAAVPAQPRHGPVNTGTLTRRPTPAMTPSAQPGGRQAAAMRKMVVAFVTLLAVTVTGGIAEIGLHGLSFFVFRSAGTGATDNNGLQENQGPGQPDAPGAHRTVRPTRPATHHSVLKPKARPST